MIPRQAIAEANRSIRGALSQAWKNYEVDMDKAYRIYMSAEDNALKNLEESKRIAIKTRDNSISDAWKLYRHTTATSEEKGTWTTYEDAKLIATRECDKALDYAEAAFANADARAEDEFKKTKDIVQATYKEDLTNAVDSFFGAHP